MRQRVASGNDFIPIVHHISCHVPGMCVAYHCIVQIQPFIQDCFLSVLQVRLNEKDSLFYALLMSIQMAFV